MRSLHSIFFISYILSAKACSSSDFRTSSLRVKAFYCRYCCSFSRLQRRALLCLSRQSFILERICRRSRSCFSFKFCRLASCYWLLYRVALNYSYLSANASILRRMAVSSWFIFLIRFCKALRLRSRSSLFYRTEKASTPSGFFVSYRLPQIAVSCCWEVFVFAVLQDI
jgi:hypothetical protein